MVEAKAANSQITSSNEKKHLSLQASSCFARGRGLNRMKKEHRIQTALTAHPKPHTFYLEGQEHSVIMEKKMETTIGFRV